MNERNEFDGWLADNIPSFQRGHYSAADVERNSIDLAQAAWKYAIAISHKTILDKLTESAIAELDRQPDGMVIRDAVRNAMRAAICSTHKSQTLTNNQIMELAKIHGGYLDDCDAWHFCGDRGLVRFARSLLAVSPSKENDNG